MLKIFEDIFFSHRQLMRRERKRNAAKGITMRPNWKYLGPGNEVHMSPSGRIKDCICGNHKKEDE